MRLKTLRQEKKMSQYELARRAGVSRVHVKRLEEGRSDPTVGMVTRLAKALGVSLAELLGIRRPR
jgi:XRE family transcriptional regulator, regulator of sulfur utilization